MAVFLTTVILGVSVILFISSTRWKLGNNLIKRMDHSTYAVYTNKTVYTSGRVAMGETIGIPIKCAIFISQREVHLIPTRFNPFLFMTDFPFTFYKKNKLKLMHSEQTEIVFTARKRNPSVFGSQFMVTIKVYDEKEKRDIIKDLKSRR